MRSEALKAEFKVRWIFVGALVFAIVGLRIVSKYGHEVTRLTTTEARTVVQLEPEQFRAMSACLDLSNRVDSMGAELSDLKTALAKLPQPSGTKPKSAPKTPAGP